MGDQDTLTNVIPKVELICRACCCEGGTMSPMWSAARSGSLPAMISFCTGLEIKHDDGKPNQICQNCIDHLNIAYDFKTTCLKSDSEFIKLLNGVINAPIKIGNGNTGIKTENQNAGNIFDDVNITDVNDVKEVKIETRIGDELSDDDFGNDDDGFSDEDIPLAQVKREPAKKAKKHKYECSSCTAVFGARAEWRQHLLTAHDGRDSNSSEKLKPGGKVYFRKDAIITGEPPAKRVKNMVKTEKKAKTKKLIESEVKTEIENDNKNDDLKNMRTDDGDRLQRRRLTLVLKQFAKKCSVCDLTFASLKACKQHKLEVHGGETSTCVCDLCGKECRLTSFRSHYQRHFLAPLACAAPGCAFREHVPSLVKKHETLVHGMHGELTMVQCTLCSKQFKYLRSLREHTAHMHGGKKKDKVCKECGATFHRKHHLARHMQRHQGDKPLSCPVCGAVFGYRSNLRAHTLKYHDLDLPKLQGGVERNVLVEKTLTDSISIVEKRKEKCPNCPLLFTRHRALREHYNKEHAPPRVKRPPGAPRPPRIRPPRTSKAPKPPRPPRIPLPGKPSFECTICGAFLSRRQHLRRHRANLHGRHSPLPDSDQEEEKMESIVMPAAPPSPLDDEVKQVEE